MQKPAYRISEFCTLYGMSRATYQKEVKEGRLRIVKNGGITLILHVDAELWLKSLQPPPKEKTGDTRTMRFRIKCFLASTKKTDECVTHPA